VKRLPWPVVVIVLIAALFFAYKSFVASFYPRLGVKSLGNPGMPPQAIEMMKKAQERDAKKQAEAASGKSSEAAKKSQPPASEGQAKKKGGD
jgi:hypothetical protein